MTWAELHGQSETLAADAELASRAGDSERAKLLYAQAAEWEEQALGTVESSKSRTLGITAVSAVALWNKAQRFDKAEHLTAEYFGRVPPFAQDQLGELSAGLRKRSAESAAESVRRSDVA